MERMMVMKRRMELTILFLSWVLALAGNCAFAGTLTVNIRQSFIAGGKSLPAGHYRIIAEDKNDQVVNIKNLDTETSFTEMHFDTRLSEKYGENGSIVFDMVGDGLYLAKIYIIGMDGFEFKGAPGKHKHLVVKGETEH